MEHISLGIHIGHDRGACLIKNGQVLAAISNERLDGIKHSQSLKIPYASIDALLNYTGIKINDVSVIGLSAVAIEGMNIYNLYKEEFFYHYKCDEKPFYLVHHHDAHAYSTYFSSRYDNALVFVFDGGGDFFESMQEAETVYFAKKGKLLVIDKRLQNMAVRHIRDEINHIYPFMPKHVQNLEMSLARKYSQISHLLGFKFGQEGKTMGLASYGIPLIDYSNINYDNLSFSLNYQDMIKEFYIMQQFSKKSFKEFLYDRRGDIASTVQNFIENVVVSIINNYTKKYGIKNICLAGGLFLNCLTNHKILEKCDIDNVFILPSAGDDGQALGSAYYAYTQEFGYKEPFKIDLPYLGLSYDNDTIESVIIQNNLNYEKHTDEELIKLTANYINENKIVSLHRGRTEIGPRALCHRSILANPTNPNMKDILNNRVKHREPFRPFAPTVTEEDQFEYFDLKCSSKYMLLATTVKEEYRKKLSAITHIDNTARIQAISKDEDPFLHALLLELKRINGFPIVLNTSFNVAGQPIVETPLDAINTFLTTDIDILVIGNFIIDKKNMSKQ